MWFVKYMKIRKHVEDIMHCRASPLIYTQLTLKIFSQLTLKLGAYSFAQFIYCS